MADATENLTISVALTEAQKALLTNIATEQGKTIEAVVTAAIQNGQSLAGLANDRALQAYFRLQQAGTIPAEVLAESARVAAQNAPKAAV